MKLNVFHFWFQGSVMPLTVFAASLQAAQDLQRRWSHSHRGENPPPVIRSEICEAGWLDDRPQWKRAVERGEAGVGAWLGHRDGWAVEAPEAALRGPLGPPETNVRLFVIEADDDEVGIVFAIDEVMASTIFLQWLHHWDKPRSKSFKVRRRSRWMLTGPETILREEMDAGISGIGGWSAEEGWHIYPPTHEATAR